MSDRKNIFLCLAHMSEEGLEQKYVKEAFDTGWVTPLGPNVDAFEADLEAFASAPDKRVVALSSGTAAMHLALLACGVGPGDEVCVQSFTFCASSHPVKYLGARPVFIDSEPETWNMDPALLETAVRDRIARTGRKPKAVVPVALYGMPYRIDEIKEIADRYDIPVVEDAAEAFGSRFDGRMLGTFGKYGVFSFNGNKMITTSGGGALVCPSAEDARTVKWYATQARDSFPYYQHSAVGYNYRMSNICAGIGRGQMTIADAHIAHHRHIQALYESLLADVSGVNVHSQPSIGSRYDSNYWLSIICLDPSLRIKGQTEDPGVPGCQPDANVEAMRVFLLSKKVEVRPVWKPMHLQPVYARDAVEMAPPAGCRSYYEGPDMVAYVNGVSESVFRVGLCLPTGPCVSDDDVRYIVDCIKASIE